MILMRVLTWLLMSISKSIGVGSGRRCSILFWNRVSSALWSESINWYVRRKRLGGEGDNQ